MSILQKLWPSTLNPYVSNVNAKFPLFCLIYLIYLFVSHDRVILILSYNRVLLSYNLMVSTMCIQSVFQKIITSDSNKQPIYPENLFYIHVIRYLHAVKHIVRGSSIQTSIVLLDSEGKCFGIMMPRQTILYIILSCYIIQYFDCYTIVV